MRLSLLTTITLICFISSIVIPVDKIDETALENSQLKLNTEGVFNTLTFQNDGMDNQELTRLNLLSSDNKPHVHYLRIADLVFKGTEIQLHLSNKETKGITLLTFIPKPKKSGISLKMKKQDKPAKKKQEDNPAKKKQDKPSRNKYIKEFHALANQAIATMTDFTERLSYYIKSEKAQLEKEENEERERKIPIGELDNGLGTPSAPAEHVIPRELSKKDKRKSVFQQRSVKQKVEVVDYSRTHLHKGIVTDLDKLVKERNLGFFDRQDLENVLNTDLTINIREVNVYSLVYKFTERIGKLNTFIETFK
jgi:hypothetical protein